MIGGAIARPLVVRETGPADSPRPRLLDRVRAAIRARYYSRRTEEAYVAWIRRYIFFHAKRHPAEMGAPEVTRFLTSLAMDGHVAASTQNQASTCPLPNSRSGCQRSSAVREVWRLLEACPHTWHRLLLATTYAAGLRVSEVVALKVSDLDADRMTVRIAPGKGAMDRYVPLSPRLLKEWRAFWQSTPPRHWLFPNRLGTRPIDITVAQKLYTLTKLRAGIRKQGGIHALRHAFATHLLEAGRDVHTVQRLLGHRYVSSTVRYFHLSQGRVLATPSPLDLPE